MLPDRSTATTATAAGYANGAARMTSAQPVGRESVLPAHILNSLAANQQLLQQQYGQSKSITPQQHQAQQQRQQSSAAGSRSTGALQNYSFNRPGQQSMQPIVADAPVFRPQAVHSMLGANFVQPSSSASNTSSHQRPIIPAGMFTSPRPRNAGNGMLSPPLSAFDPQSSVLPAQALVDTPTIHGRNALMNRGTSTVAARSALSALSVASAQSVQSVKQLQSVPAQPPVAVAAAAAAVSVTSMPPPKIPSAFKSIESQTGQQSMVTPAMSATVSPREEVLKIESQSSVTDHSHQPQPQPQPDPVQEQLPTVTEQNEQSQQTETTEEQTPEIKPAYTLLNWHLQLIKSNDETDYVGLRVRGFDEKIGSYRFSTAINERINTHLVRTRTGSYVGLGNEDFTNQTGKGNNAPEELYRHFYNGFPENWNETFDNYALKYKERILRKQLNQAVESQFEETQFNNINSINREIEYESSSPPTEHELDSTVGYKFISQPPNREELEQFAEAEAKSKSKTKTRARAAEKQQQTDNGPTTKSASKPRQAKNQQQQQQQETPQIQETEAKTSTKRRLSQRKTIIAGSEEDISGVASGGSSRKLTLTSNTTKATTVTKSAKKRLLEVQDEDITVDGNQSDDGYDEQDEEPIAKARVSRQPAKKRLRRTATDGDDESEEHEDDDDDEDDEYASNSKTKGKGKARSKSLPTSTATSKSILKSRRGRSKSVRSPSSPSPTKLAEPLRTTRSGRRSYPPRDYWRNEPRRVHPNVSFDHIMEPDGTTSRYRRISTLRRKPQSPSSVSVSRPPNPFSRIQRYNDDDDYDDSE
ncbi:hypothetical protein GQ42DRAFT_175794 [Ramicandelaber brevisporus]|nr:hypothetical protein GQ42DRAFT_175794 [Ramicandelaber brevisporus]